EVIGSWKTMAIFCALIGLMTAGGALRISRPSKATEPVARPFFARSPITAKASWLLPEPDSPTIPRVSPRSSERLTPLTAVTVPSGVSKRTERLRISSMAISAVLGIERVAQPVADEEEREERGDEEGQRPKKLPGRAVVDRPRPFRDQRAERGQRLLDAKPEEGDEALDQDHLGDQQRGIDSDDADEVRHYVAQDDGEGRHAGGLRRLDILLVLEAQRLAPDDPRHVEPGHQPDAEEEHEERPAEHHE